MRHTIGGWKQLLSEDDKAQYSRVSFGKLVPPGESPAVHVIDMTRMMYDPEIPSAPEDGAESVVKGCVSLVEFARGQGWPVTWSLRSSRSLPVERGGFDWKKDYSRYQHPGSDEFAAPLQPEDGDLLVYKPKPSSLWETPFRSQLQYMGIDSLIVCGMSTSGCVLSTAVDAFSSNLKVFIAEEATGDRSYLGHDTSLLLMNMKYASVLTSEDIKSHLT